MVEADGLELFVRHGGRGPAVLLLHGHPRTSATWHRVGIDSGHHVAELVPDELVADLGSFLG